MARPVLNFVFAGVAACTGALSHPHSASAKDVPFLGSEGAKLPRRLGLVIGVERYTTSGGGSLRELPDATKDADRMEDVLRKYKFDVARLKTEKYIEKGDVLNAVSDFRKRVKAASEEDGRPPIVAVYFAGHGFSYGGGNYLLPSKVVMDTAEHALTTAVDLKREVIDEIAKSRPALIVSITDTCRTSSAFDLPNDGGATTKVPPGAYKPGDTFLLPEAGPGVARVIFLYSALSSGKAYAQPQVGGRFSVALGGALSQALTDASSESGTAPRRSLREMFERVKWDMQFVGQKKWQLPEMDDSRGAIFFPLPSEIDYKAESITFNGLEKLPDPSRSYSYNEQRQACRMRDMLFAYSEFSYFSDKVIAALDRLRGPEECEPVNSIEFPTGVQKNEDGQWSFQPPGRRGDRRSGRVRLAQAEEAVEGKTSRSDESAALSRAGRPAGAPGARPTFGDLRRIAGTTEASPAAAGFPPDAIPLDQAVVANRDSNLRSDVGPSAPAKGVVQEGEVLQMLGTSPGGTWVQVSHPRLGDGYISGDLVDTALVTVSKEIRFPDGVLELPEAAKADLIYTFGLLGGLVVLDASVVYPQEAPAIGLARATTVSSFVQSLLRLPRSADTGPGGDTSFIFAIRRASDRATPAGGTVKVNMVVFPLDPKARSSLARSSGGGARVRLELTSWNGQAGPTGTPSLVYCKEVDGKCDQRSVVRSVNAVFNNPRQVFGGPDSVFNSPKEVVGGPNSVVSDPGKLLRSLETAGSVKPDETTGTAPVGRPETVTTTPTSVPPLEIGRLGGRRVCIPWC